MRENVKIYTLSALIFLCILSLGGGFSEPLSLIFRIVAFLVPAALILKLSKAESQEETRYLSVDKRGALLFPLALPSLLVIFALSYLVSLIIYTLLGLEADTPASGNLLYDVFSLAVVPAVFEELLFRYLPLKTIAPYSKKSALIISALFFAMVHASFFSIPYAFVAGIIFMLLDLICDSVWPSVILHLLNNLLSIVWIYNSQNAAFALVFWAALVLGSLFSLIAVLFMRKKYAVLLRSAFTREDKFSLPPITLALIIPTLAIAALELI